MLPTTWSGTAAAVVGWRASHPQGTQSKKEDFLLAADQRAEDSSSKHKFLIKLLNKSTLFLANISF